MGDRNRDLRPVRNQGHRRGPLNDRAKLPLAKVEDEVSFVEAVTRFSGSSASSAGPASVQKDDRGNSCSAVQHWHLSHSGRKTGRNRISAAHHLTTILVNSPSWWGAGGKRRFVQQRRGSKVYRMKAYQKFIGYVVPCVFVQQMLSIRTSPDPQFLSLKVVS